MTDVPTSITAVLTVRDGTTAVDFCRLAFGAEEVFRTTSPDGRITAELAIGGARMRIYEESPESGNLGPESLGGTTVRLNLLVAEPDAVAKQAVACGAVEVAPVADQSFGLRPGRLVDPYGHTG